MAQQSNTGHYVYDKKLDKVVKVSDEIEHKKSRGHVYLPPEGRMVEHLTPRPVYVPTKQKFRELLKATKSAEV